MARCMDLAIWPELAYLQASLSFYYFQDSSPYVDSDYFSRGFGSRVFCPDFQVANQKSTRITRNLVAYVKDWKTPVSDGCLQSYRA